MDLLVDGRYRAGRQIGAGSAGTVYEGVDEQSGEKVAIKLQSVHDLGDQQITNEVQFFQSTSGLLGFPTLLWHGRESDYHVLVMKLLGPTLSDLCHYCSGQFSLKTTLMLATQLIDRFECFHSKGAIHLSVKTPNFLIGCDLDNCHVVHLIDFGRAMHYIDLDTKEHIGLYHSSMNIFNGDYSSVHAMDGAQQSRRDDMISLGYTQMRSLRGSLPWTQDECVLEAMVAQRKKQDIDGLCNGYPPEFAEYFRHCYALKFEDKPNYTYLRQLFEKVMLREGYACDFKYDWISKILSAQGSHLESSWQTPTAPAYVYLGDHNKPEAAQEGRPTRRRIRGKRAPAEEPERNSKGKANAASKGCQSIRTKSKKEMAAAPKR